MLLPDRIPADGEGAGRDTLDFSALTSPVTVRLIPSGDNEAVSGTSTLNFLETAVVEVARGGASDDIIRGNAADNRPLGNGGNDEVSGNTDPETVYGGAGNDTVNTFGGDDFVDVVDGQVGDTVDCHIGTNDTIRVDRRFAVFGVRTDMHVNCENVVVVTSSR